jgi:hypothetical protein
MAAIVPSDLAPEEQVHYSFAGAEFDLAPGGSFETADRTILTNAEAHPWLDVDYPEADESIAVFRGGSLPPSQDALSMVNSVAFDREEIEKVEQTKIEAITTPTALDAGKDQGEVIFSGRVVAETLAADEVAEENAEEVQQEVEAEQEALAAEQAAQAQTEPVKPVESTTDSDVQDQADPNAAQEG